MFLQVIDGWEDLAAIFKSQSFNEKIRYVIPYLNVQSLEK